MPTQDPPEWQGSLQRLRQKAAQKPGHTGKQKKTAPGPLSHEALMTLAAIMKEQDDPRLQLAAAKTLLQQADAAAGHDSTASVSPHDIDAAIALAKELLDELARRKTQGLAGAGPLGSEGKR